MHPNRRSLLVALSATGFLPSLARAEETLPGVTSTEIRIGTTLPLSGPAASYGVAGRAMEAYFSTVNDAGGVNGRKLRLIVADDAFSPNRTVEQTRRLVEQEHVLLMMGQTGTACSLAVRQYLNDAKVPQLFIASGAPAWIDEVEKFPWSLGFPPSYVSEGQGIARHILATRPNAKVGVLFQNDDSGKGFLRGLREGFATNPRQIVREESAETVDPTVDSQVIALQTSGADVMVSFNVPKATAQAIRRSYDLQWRPQIYIGSVSTSVPQVMVPAGIEKSKGVISSSILKDPTDPTWDGDMGMKEFIATMKKYSPQTALDSSTTGGASIAMVTCQLLRQCGNNLSRDNVLAQTMRLDLQPPLLLPGLRIKTSAQERAALRSWRLQQFDGARWNLLPGA